MAKEPLSIRIDSYTKRLIGVLGPIMTQKLGLDVTTPELFRLGLLALAEKHKIDINASLDENESAFFLSLVLKEEYDRLRADLEPADRDEIQRMVREQLPTDVEIPQEEALVRISKITAHMAKLAANRKPKKKS